MAETEDSGHGREVTGRVGERGLRTTNADMVAVLVGDLGEGNTGKRVNPPVVWPPTCSLAYTPLRATNYSATPPPPPVDSKSTRERGFTATALHADPDVLLCGNADSEPNAVAALLFSRLSAIAYACALRSGSFDMCMTPTGQLRFDMAKAAPQWTSNGTRGFGCTSAGRERAWGVGME